ncbi:MAG: hypothetical protein LBU89_01035 [Fibromonadaceae bacterium]|jgi:hypothetical protein|nr:hypothetical protein [Fibromonadaceae bacterium]
MKKYFFAFCLVLMCLLIAGCGPTIIRYEVTGTAPSVNITMNNSHGGTEQLSNVSLPWFKEFRLEKYARDPEYDDGNYVGASYLSYLSTQNNGYSGSITVKIYRNGRECQKATSTGAHVTATASKKILPGTECY